MRKHAFETLFKLLHRDEPAFRFPLEHVLARLDRTDAVALTNTIRQRSSYHSQPSFHRSKKP